MRKEIIQYLDQRQDLKYFIRIHPEWYKRLSRNPNDLQALERVAKQYYKGTILQKVNRFQEQIQMAQMLLGMLSILKEE
ncbi:YlbE-like family protein [Bacillus taeanensis]|uniref:YlbE-like protein n=1 Tax=Bacillus taeanensis TaxID=273032 RepID=A0A366XYL6_9BACI|nr:YlbE-like family protein [Bacillus taeanensis]RBW70235.1 hypothetical protein DS031_06590 [Bacillus taeanensis]